MKFTFINNLISLIIVRINFMRRKIKPFFSRYLIRLALNKLHEKCSTSALKTYQNIKDYKSNSYYITVLLQLNHTDFKDCD